MKHLLLFITLVLALVACDPEDVVNVDVNPSPAVEDAVNRVQEGVQGVGNTLENLGQDARERVENAGDEVEQTTD